MLDSEGRLKLAEGPARARLLVAGDLCPIYRLEGMLAGGDVDGAFGDTRALFERADLTVVNLESPLCVVETPIAKCGPNFRARPEVAGALAAAPVHVAGLANNHIMDQGPKGLAETVAALDAAGLKHLGAGPSAADAAAPLFLEVNGLKLALLAFAGGEFALSRGGPGAAGLDPVDNCRVVSDAAGRADLVIVFLHVGCEQVLFPAPELGKRCREMIDAGAAAVLCHHPHVPQGIEVYRGRPIACSLGNFLFDWPEPEPETDSSFLLELEVAASGVGSLEVHPLAKTPEAGAGLLAGQRRSDYIALLNELSAPLSDAAAGSRLWDQQCRALFETWYRPRLARIAELDAEDPQKRLRARLSVLNMFNYDSHREAISNALRLAAAGELADDEGARARLDELMKRLKGFAPA